MVLVAKDMLPVSWMLVSLGAVAATILILVQRHLSAVSRVRRRLKRRARAETLEAAVPSLSELSRRIGGPREAHNRKTDNQEHDNRWQDGPGLGAEVGEGLAVALDRSDRTLARHVDRLKALADARATIIDGIPEPLILIDGRVRIAYANFAARQQFGERIVDRDLSAVIRHPDVLSGVKSALGGGVGETGTDNGAGFIEIEIAIAAPVERAFSIRIQPLAEKQPGARSVLMLFMDLTSVRRTEQMRVDFVANVSHELRTPLATLLGFIETLQGPAREDADARERFLDIMRSQANRMSRLVNDLLSLSRIEINEHTAPIDRVSCAPILRNVVTAIEMEAKRKDMRVELELEADLPDVLGEEDELSQVAQNLIDNAIKYGRAGTEVTVTAKRATSVPASYTGTAPTAVVITVRDRGEGIAQEHIPRLTERFYRVDTARSRELGGTGLGLAIVKHIVSRHRGALTVESTVGEGTTLAVYLPSVAPREAR
jgi:two-component system phosphate regulon sensor histidine kinase PhoR